MTHEAATRLAIMAAVAALLVPASVSAYAQGGESAEPKFLLPEIAAAFEASEPYITYNEADYITVDMESMRADGAHALDIEIMTKWAMFLNELVDAMESGNQTAAQDVITTAKKGQFGLFVDPRDLGDSGTVTGGGHALPRLNLFAICGIIYPYTWHDPPVSTYPYTNYSTKDGLINRVVGDGYHKVAFYATGNYGNDYQKTNPTGVGGCTGGEFRDQRIVYEGTPGHSDERFRTGWYVRQHTNEPNPEVTTYVPPTTWWPVYVTLWHGRY